MNDSHSAPERRCTYCQEVVQAEATICPHCRSFIDPRFPPGLVDEGAYRRAKIGIVAESKEAISNWAHSWVKWAVVLLSVLVPLGAYAFLHLTASQMIELVFRAEMGRTFRDFEERIGGLNNRLAQLEATIGTSQTALTAATNRAEYAVQMAETLSRRSAAESQAKRELVASRVGPTRPSLILTHPESLKAERPIVFYQTANEEIRFRWTWFAETAGTDTSVYRLEIWPDRDTVDYSLFATNTVFESLRIAPYQAFAAMAMDPAEREGKFYWKVVTTDPTAPGSVISSEDGVFEYYSDAMARIMKKREVRVGITVEQSPPFVRQESDGSGVTGFDIELAREIVKLVPDIAGWSGGAQPVFLQFDWIPLLNALRSGAVDVIISSITKRAERETEYELLFSDTYYTTFQAALVTMTNTPAIRHLLNSEISGPAFAGISVVAVNGTTGFEAAKTLVSDATAVLRKSDLSEVVNSLLSGEAMVAVMDAPIALEEQRKMPELLEVISLRHHYRVSDDYGLAVGKGQENLLRTINLCLAVLRNRQVLEELKKTHGLPD